MARQPACWLAPALLWAAYALPPHHCLALCCPLSTVLGPQNPEAAASTGAVPAIAEDSFFQCPRGVAAPLSAVCLLRCNHLRLGSALVVTTGHHPASTQQMRLQQSVATDFVLLCLLILCIFILSTAHKAISRVGHPPVQQLHPILQLYSCLREHSTAQL